MSRAFTAVPGGERTVTLARREHGHQGICSAAGFGLWAGAGGFRGGLPGLPRPRRLGPAGVRAAAMCRIKVAAAAAAKGEADARCHLANAGHQASRAAG